MASLKFVAFIAVAFLAIATSGYVLPDPPAPLPSPPAWKQLKSIPRAANSVFHAIGDPALSCAVCMDIAALLGPAVRSNLTLDAVLAIGIPICALLEKNAGYPDCGESTCPTLCRGLITEESVDVLSVALDTVLAPAEVCYLLGVCPAPPPPPTPSGYIPVPSNLADTTGEKAWPSWNLTSGTGTFVHITDIHVDLKYAVGTNSTCAMPICCREQFGPGNATHSAGAWGDYACDPPLSLVESLFEHIASLDPVPDFILYTGDDPAHDIWEQSRAANLNSIDTVSALMLKYFPHIPVYSAIGNHETYPVNQFQGPAGDDWLTKNIMSAWSYYLPADAQRTLAYGGYFQMRVRPGLRVISLNTNLYANEDFWLVANHTDFSCQMNWLEDVLTQAEARSEKVLIISHAVCHSWYTDFCDRYGLIVTRFESTIIGMFNGHTHVSSSQLFYNNASGTPVPSHIAYMAGSVTMVYGVNPTYRVMSYDRALPFPYFATDFNQYWTDVPTANRLNKPDWTTLRYTPLQAYDMVDLSPASWYDMSQRLLSNQTLFQTYFENYSRGAVMKGNHPPTPRALSCEISSESAALAHACNKQDPNWDPDTAPKLDSC